MNRKLYIGNLDFGITEDELRELFSQHGEVQDVKLVTDRETGRPRGFGFVTMATADDASKAMEELNGQSVRGRNISIDLARAEQRDRRERTPFRR